MLVSCGEVGGTWGAQQTLEQPGLCLQRAALSTSAHQRRKLPNGWLVAVKRRRESREGGAAAAVPFPPDILQLSVTGRGGVRGGGDLLSPTVSRVGRVDVHHSGARQPRRRVKRAPPRPTPHANASLANAVSRLTLCFVLVAAVGRLPPPRLWTCLSKDANVC